MIGKIVSHYRILAILTTIIAVAEPSVAQEKPLQRIAFGSCTRQMQDAPMLNTVVAAKPDLFLMIGDVIYPDINDEATALLDPWPSEDAIERIKQVYAQMAAKPEYQNLKKNIPMMAVWDDHDYGIQDGSADFSLKDESQRLFLDFFDEPVDSERRKTPGIYDAKTIGPEGQRVQIILLDVRYFRTPPLPDTRSDEEKKALNISGRYAPNEDPAATVLGETQWRWLEQRFREPAELRLLVSAYPLIPNELGDALFAPKSFEDNTDLLFRGELAAGLAFDLSNHALGVGWLVHGPLLPCYNHTSEYPLDWE